MTNPAPATAITLLWQRQSIWSQAANQVKARINRSRVTALTLIIAGAVLATASAQLVDGQHPNIGRGLAALAAVALGLASLANRGSAPQIVRDWTRARSVSEAIKSDVYCYLAGAGPFRGADPEQVALRRLDELLQPVGDLVKYTTGIAPANRELPAIEDVASYAEIRVTQQISEYYQPKAREMARLVRFTRGLEFALGAIGAVLAAVVAVFPSTGVSAWIGVLTTVAAAVAAHAGASRYEYQQIEFTRTAEELERLVAGGAVGPEFVLACEHVISIQNEGWMAKLGTDAENA